MNKRIDFNHFVVEDGQYFKRWDSSAPLFDNFYIFGPETFESKCKPTCLYQFPNLFKQNELINSNNNDNYDFNNEKIRLEIKMKTQNEQLAQFFFPDGIHYIENDKCYLENDISYINTFSKQPKTYDNIIFIKSEGSIPHYFFGIRYICSPYTRPSASLPNEMLFNSDECDQNNDSNLFVEYEKKLYLEKMKKCFEKEMVSSCISKNCPTCLFAFVFETRHPFIELYFNLIHQIAFLEASEKSNARNLHILLSSYLIDHKSITNPKIERKLNDEDNYFLNKFNDDNDNIPNKFNDDNDNIPNKFNDEDYFFLNKFHCFINDDSFESTTPDKNHNQKDSIHNNEEFKFKENIQNEINSNSQNTCMENIQLKSSNEKEKENVNKNIQNLFDLSWPARAFNSRNEFLKTLLQKNMLPSNGQDMIIQTGESKYSKFSWKIPTIDQSYRYMINYGIIPLLEWISLNDLIWIVSLIFLEVSVIVIGKNIESIVRVVSAFPHIVYPFAWMFPIMTIIPDSLMDILDSPIPFIAGVFLNQKNLKKIVNLFSFDDSLIIDMENHIIKWPRIQYPRISDANEYIFSLKKFCTANKQSNYENLYSNSINDFIFISNEVQKKKNSKSYINEIFNKVKKMNFIHRSNDDVIRDLFFNLSKIDDIVEAILNITHKVFISKILPAIVTRVKVSDDGEDEIGSMLVDEIYCTQFSDKEKNLPFLNFFMKTQMFISYKEEACKSRTDQEAGIIENKS